MHLDFCDFLNLSQSEWDRTHNGKGGQEKEIHFVINEKNSKWLMDSVFENFIKKDKFLQHEIHKNYYRLNVVFYKKSELTDALIKEKSSRYLDYCEKDILVEYLWREGKFDGSCHYDNGVIGGTEKIHIDTIK